MGISSATDRTSNGEKERRPSGQEEKQLGHRRGSRTGHPLVQLYCALLMLWPLLSSCSSAAALAPQSVQPVRPVIKIGLLAPFEGLHRRSGYAALAAMRLALAAYPGQEIAMMPLALHLDSVDLSSPQGQEQARRTVEKLLADPDLRAVVGPYDPALVALIRPLMAETTLPWFLPFAPDPKQDDAVATFLSDLSTPTSAAMSWLVSLVQDVAAQTARQGAQRLIVAGWQSTWFSSALFDDQSTALPLVFFADMPDDRGVPAVGDALLWLGAPEASVPFLMEERQEGWAPHTLWFGPMGSEPVLPELFLSEFTFDSNKLFWVTWLDTDDLTTIDPINSTDAQSSRSLSPTAYLTYRATAAAIAMIDRAYAPRASVPDELPSTQWQLIHFALQVDGTSRQLDKVEN